MRAVVASIVALLVASLATSAPARADATEDTARAHLDRGVAAFRAGDYTLAHRELSAASALVPDKPNPYRWLALTEVQRGDCRSALAHIDDFVSRVPTDDPRLAELARLRDLCQRTGILHVESTPPNVALRIDGALVGTTPYRALSMRAGSHVLVAEHAGYTRESRSIIVPAGGQLDVRFALSPPRPPLVRRWWFWAAVAGVAVTATAAIAYAANDREPTLLPPIDCSPTGCIPGAP